MMTESPLRLGIAGLGTVGGSVVELLQSQKEILRQRCARPLEIRAVSARDARRSRGVSLQGMEWVEDAVALAHRDDIDVVVELIGGADGVAFDLCRSALEAGKHVVTANKAMLARHGFELAQLAEHRNRALAFEAAVAGGIPIVKALREGAAANSVESVTGILNGTCNYILTTMAKTGAPFADVLAEAQQLGYAEADPGFDIDGWDTAHKLTILASIAFGVRPAFQSISVEGIRFIRAEDVRAASELGFTIKLLGVARMDRSGISQRVYPCLVPLRSPISHVDGVHNAIEFSGDYIGQVMIQGRGAGGGPTASAVAADLVDIANGRLSTTFGQPATALAEARPMDGQASEGHYYLRFLLHEQTGAVARLAAVLSKHGVSIRTLVQKDESQSGDVPLYLTTHRCAESAMRAALAEVQASSDLAAPPMLLRIEYF
jgi:homoserine dehydrogenase